MTIEIENTVDHEDGGATFTFTMSHDEMVEFAQIGMKQCLIDAAREPDYYEEVLALRAELSKLKANSF